MKIIVQETITIDKVYFTQCDLCEATTQSNQWTVNTLDGLVYYDTSIWMDGDNGKSVEVDICPNCFLNKVIPALEALGAKIKK